jgi:YD repeat-containing protein
VSAGRGYRSVEFSSRQENANNYGYDPIGNMISVVKDSINNIDWSVYGKILKIDKDNNARDLVYSYDPSGNRVSKAINGMSTYYVRDAQGNNLAIYENRSGAINWLEQSLYGSSRLGLWRPNINLADINASGTAQWGYLWQKVL